MGRYSISSFGSCLVISVDPGRLKVRRVVINVVLKCVTKLCDLKPIEDCSISVS